jgi:hypothetical protein
LKNAAKMISLSVRRPGAFVHKQLERRRNRLRIRFLC